MLNPVKINGAVIDGDDPCALFQALYAFKLSALAGGKVEEVEVRSPVTSRRTRFGATNLPALEAELSRLQAACEKIRGGRRRYAQRGTFRPH